MNDDKRKQIRRTHHDTLISQKKIRDIIKNKINTNKGLTENEKNEWDLLIGNAFLSVGTDKRVYLDRAEIRIDFGTVHTFALYFIDWEDPVQHEYKKQIYTIPLKTLWEILYKCCLELFPYALADALHMSKEVEEREQWNPFEFSSKRGLQKDENIT